MRHSITLFILALLLNGCATLSKEECQQGNWSDIGFRDGSRGEPAGLLHEHKKACAKHRISIDENAYHAGRQRGLDQVYCKPRNAYRIGLAGGSYGNVCSPRMEREFLAAFRYGEDIHKLKVTAGGQRNTLNQLQARQGQLSTEIQSLEDILNNYPQGSFRNRLNRHVKGELDRILDRLDRATERYEADLRLVPRQQRTLNAFVDSANKHGRTVNRLAWIQRQENLNELDQRKIRRLENRVHESRDKMAALRARLPGGPVERLNRIQRLAVYSGMLDSQLKTLRRLRSRHEVKKMVELHYERELLRIKETSDKTLLRDIALKSRHELRQDLDRATHEFERIRIDIMDAQTLLQDTLDEIQQREQSSPYR